MLIVHFTINLAIVFLLPLLRHANMKYYMHRQFVNLDITMSLIKGEEMQ